MARSIPDSFARVRRLGQWTLLVIFAAGFLREPSGAHAGEVDYTRHIKPVLRERCYACHGPLKQESGLRLDTAAAAIRGGDGGAAIVAGDPAASALWQRVASDDAALRMPPEGEPLTAEQLEQFRAWIAAGAPAPGDEQPEPDPRDHWAFRVPRRPSVPLAAIPPAADSQTASTATTDVALAVDNPIDAFIQRRLDEQRLTPIAPAERSLLLRRVYLDLIGLPPSRDELHAFLADDSPDAYERVVDRLLASPRYGERWGRHWMDVWRYSDWYGRRSVPDVWNSAPQIWRWRDWIVQSLNDDAGYDHMLRMMLAADEIAPDDDRAAVATGYLIRNWYALNPNDWMRNNVEHTGKAMLGLTFNCAHCHDHKYDPITHEDYFRFRAFFETIGIRQNRWAGEADPGPFQEYDYSTLRKVVRIGSVSVFDKQPDAPTWFYTGGDERNRLTERGSIPPGLPAVFGQDPVPIQPTELPAAAWYPGLRPSIQQTELSDAERKIELAAGELAAAGAASDAELPALLAAETKAAAEFDAAAKAARAAGESNAITGRQSLLLDATTGRRILNLALREVDSLHDGDHLRFQVRLLTNTHFNFQLARDAVKGLTAGYVAFDAGRILAYEPSSFREFEIGRYDFAAGQTRFDIEWTFHPSDDTATLRIVCRGEKSATEISTNGNSTTGDAAASDAAESTVLVDGTRVAINGWNPVGDPTKTITFDAHAGSVTAIDQIEWLRAAGRTPLGPDISEALQTVVLIDFELPAYSEGRDVVGRHGWTASSFCQPPATSTVSATIGDTSLSEQAARLRATSRAVEAVKLRVTAAEAAHAAAKASRASVAARIAADNARYRREVPDDASRHEAKLQRLIAEAARSEREANMRRATANRHAAERQLALAESKATDDANRAKEIDAAHKQLAAAQAELTQAEAAIATAERAGERVGAAAVEAYSPLSPMYPTTSTGRRRALARWITSRENPLTARVAVNHIWLRHFHQPLVASVFDFGQNGARPTHPELLDWLAVELMESGWSMKHLHRLIVTSQAYRRQSSANSADATSDSTAAARSRNMSLDPQNQWLWRMNTGRMESEVVRDSVLLVSDGLDLAIGGQEFENSEALTNPRRSLYFCCQPEADGKSQFGSLFDAPDALECYRRSRSIMPQQALALTNNEMIHAASQRVASRLSAELREADRAASEAFVDAAFESLLSRPPTRDERRVCLAFLEQQSAATSADATVAARESLIRVLLNHNDFITIR